MRTSLIYRVDALPVNKAPCALYIVKTPNSNLYDLYLTSVDGSTAERIITDSDVDAMLASKSNIPNGLVTLDINQLIPLSRIPDVTSKVGNLAVDTSGNAATATKLKTARTINGVLFDGSGNITINAVDSTARIASSEKGAANGVATLDSGGKVPSSQLPSFVDDVLEYANLAAFPATGEAAKIYVALDTNKVYRWTGSIYVQVNSSVSTADSATRLQTARTFTISGDGSFTLSFDGTQDVTANLVLADTGVTAGESPVVTFNSKGLITGSRALSQADIPSLPGSKIGSTILVDTTGNAATATKLKTARNINGTSFDGTVDITIPAVDTVTPRVPWSSVGAPNGVASLDSASKVLQVAGKVDGQDTDLQSNGLNVWKEIATPFSIKALSGTNNPTFGTTFGSMQGLLFSASTMQQVWADITIPHDYAVGTEVFPKIDWMPTTNGSGSVIWVIEYTIAKRDGTFSTTITPIVFSHSVTSGSQWKHMVTEALVAGQGITSALLEPGATIKMRIYRDAASSSDTYNGTVSPWQISLHYQVGQIGTRGRTSNYFA